MCFDNDNNGCGCNGGCNGGGNGGNFLWIILILILIFAWGGWNN